MLSSVVDTECWEGAREAAAAQGKHLATQLASANAVLGTLKSLQEQGAVELQKTQQQEEDWRQAQGQKLVGGCCMRKGGQRWGIGVFPPQPSAEVKVAAASIEPRSIWRHGF
jgi:hypothetical protein